MGKAIIIPDVSFASANLGQVTLTEEIPVRAISIVAPASFIGVTLDTLRIIYNPLNTSERGVTWSIISGSAYATINSATGVLTILSGASANNVTIKATSTADSSITAEATIKVTYSAGDVPTPVYTIDRTYNSYQSDSERIQKANTPVGDDYIVLVTLSQQLDTDYNFRAFSHTQTVSPYEGYFLGRGASGISPNEFGMYANASAEQEEVLSLVGKRKMAVKVVGNQLSITTDGVDWTLAQLQPSMSVADTFAFGRNMIGTLKIDFFNDTTIDMSQFFV